MMLRGCTFYLIHVRKLFYLPRLLRQGEVGFESCAEGEAL